MNKWLRIKENKKGLLYFLLLLTVNLKVYAASSPEMVELPVLPEFAVYEWLNGTWYEDGYAKFFWCFGSKKRLKIFHYYGKPDELTLDVPPVFSEDSNDYPVFFDGYYEVTKLEGEKVRKQFFNPGFAVSPSFPARFELTILSHEPDPASYDIVKAVYSFQPLFYNPDDLDEENSMHSRLLFGEAYVGNKNQPPKPMPPGDTRRLTKVPNQTILEKIE